jgi:hypothetical protein
MTNFGDVITSAISGDPRYQLSIIVASSPSGPNPVQYSREDAETLTDAQASGIAQDLSGEGIDHGYYNQYRSPEWFFEYRSENILAYGNGVSASGWSGTGSAALDMTGDGFVTRQNTVLDTTGNKYRLPDVYRINSIDRNYHMRTAVSGSDPTVQNNLHTHTVGSIFVKAKVDSTHDDGMLWRFDHSTLPASGLQTMSFRFNIDGSIMSVITSRVANGAVIQSTTFKSATSLVSDGEWYRVGFRQDGTTMKTWLNGEEIPWTVTGTTANQGFWFNSLLDRNGGVNPPIDRMTLMGDVSSNAGLEGSISYAGYTSTVLSDSMMQILTHPNTSNF